jgi:hypothetical protein
MVNHLIFQGNKDIFKVIYIALLIFEVVVLLQLFILSARYLPTLLPLQSSFATMGTYPHPRSCMDTYTVRGHTRALYTIGGHALAVSTVCGHTRALYTIGGHALAVSTVCGHTRALSSIDGSKWTLTAAITFSLCTYCN